MPSGPLAAAIAYVLWGLFPLYIKQIAHIPALEIVLHRSLWSLVFVFGLLAVLRRFAWLPPVLRQPRTLGLFLLSALLLGGNWLLYVWAVNAGRVLDASLGYFINPLVNVVLGYAVLHERPRPVQWAAVALAAVGVVWLAWGAGHLPWVSIVLALSFGLYGLLRKTASLGAIEGLALETLLLGPWPWPVCCGCRPAGRRTSPRVWPATPGGCCSPARPPPCRCCCLRRAHAGCRWPPWGCCSTSARRSSSCSACSPTASPSAPVEASASC